MDQELPPTKQLILLRHAHRASSFENDPSLSPMGLDQASALPRHLARLSIAAPQLILVSPKRRAQQTVWPLAEAFGLMPDTDQRLDERQHEESRTVFDGRIRDFVSAVAQHVSSPILACTHMDWLESVMLQLPSRLSEEDSSRPWAAGEFRVLNLGPDGFWSCSHTGVVPGGI